MRKLNPWDVGPRFCHDGFRVGWNANQERCVDVSASINHSNEGCHFSEAQHSSCETPFACPLHIQYQFLMAQIAAKFSAIHRCTSPFFHTRTACAANCQLPIFYSVRCNLLGQSIRTVWSSSICLPRSRALRPFLWCCTGASQWHVRLQHSFEEHDSG